MNRKATLTAVFTMVAVCWTSAQARGDLPPRYAVTVLDALEGGDTYGQALNELGQTTGESGSGLVSIGTHAFLGSPGGSIVDIETVPGYDLSEGSAINDAAQIAGTLTYFPGTTGVSTMFIYTPNAGMVEIGTLGGTRGTVVDINEAGDVTGEWDLPNGDAHAFLYTEQDGLIDLGTLGDYESRARDINDARQIVGYSWTSDWDIHAFLWEDGVMHDLGTLGGDWSDAYYVNSDGVIVGSSKDASGTFHAFRYTVERGMEALPAPAGATSCTATRVTPSGLVTGWWRDDQGFQRAFYYTDDEGTVDLEITVGSSTWTGPVAANDAGQIVLWVMDDHTYEVFAYVYDPATGAHDLNDLLAVELDWTITEPADINEAGQVLVSGFGVGSHAGYYSALLTPITPGDLDADGDVDLADLAQLLASYGATGGVTYANGDIDADGDVDLADLAYLLGVYGTDTE